MILVWLERDALTGLEDHGASGMDSGFDTIERNGDVFFAEVPGCIAHVQHDFELTAASVDDVLGFGFVKVMQDELIGLADQNFFTIYLAAALG